jgi:hypothetical protein
MPPINLSKGLKMQPTLISGGLGAALIDYPIAINEQNVINSSRESGIVCRICLEEEDVKNPGENPFITPCKCIGSMKYIHVTCLRDWLDAKK